MSKRIMVVDNDMATRELIEYVLEDEGWEVFAYDFAHADLKEVQQLTPDLILLDLNGVFVGQGWSFLQLLKMENSTAMIPAIICTTVENLSLELEGYLTSQHIGILRKPLDIDALIHAINTSFAPRRFLPILVVEDNEQISNAITTILQLEGYVTTTASNGLKALNAVSQVQHSLILLDISMPAMNGFEFLATYAQKPGYHSPVIISSGEEDIWTKSLPAFVIDVLPKPFEVNHFLALVSKYVQPIQRELAAIH
jgi:CheY-like chemotaxis protein